MLEMEVEKPENYNSDKEDLPSNNDSFRDYNRDSSSQYKPNVNTSLLDKLFDERYRYALDPHLHIFLGILFFYDSILLGTKIRIKSRKKACIHNLSAKPFEPEFIKLQAFAKNLQQIDCDCKSEHIFDEEDIESRYPNKENVWSKATLFFIKYVRRAAIISYLARSIVFLSPENLGWLECSFPGRFIFKAEIIQDINSVMISISVQQTILEIIQYLRKDHVHFDCSDFVLSPKSYVINEINCHKVANFEIINLMAINPTKARSKINHMINQNYNPAFYIQSTYGLLLKWNRDIESYTYLVRFLYMTYSSISVLPTVAFVTVPTFILSLKDFYEYHGYPMCNTWINARANKTFVLPNINEYRLNLSRTAEIYDNMHFDNPMYYYHAIGNSLLVIWLVLSQTITTFANHWIMFIAVLDGKLYARAISKRLNNLILSLDILEEDEEEGIDNKLLSTKLMFQLDSLCFQIKAYIENIRDYNELTFYTLPFFLYSFAILVAPLGYYILGGAFQSQFEIYSLMVASGCQGIILMAILNIQRTESIVVYRLVASLASKLQHTEQKRISNILTLFEPPSLHCFTVWGNEVSLMYGLRVSVFNSSVILFFIIYIF